MKNIDSGDLTSVVGGKLEMGNEPKPEGFMNRELGRIQRTLPFGSTRDDAVREWNGRMQQYRQDEYKRQYKRWLDAPRKII